MKIQELDLKTAKLLINSAIKKRNVGAVFYVNEEDAKNIDDFNYYVSMTEKTNEDGDIVVLAERYTYRIVRSTSGCLA